MRQARKRVLKRGLLETCRACIEWWGCLNRWMRDLVVVMTLYLLVLVYLVYVRVLFRVTPRYLKEVVYVMGVLLVWMCEN